MKIPNGPGEVLREVLSLARIVSEDSQPAAIPSQMFYKSSKDS